MIYILGRDESWRPVIYIDATKILPGNINKEVILNTLIYVISITKTFMFYPGKIENFLVIIDVKNLTFEDPSKLQVCNSRFIIIYQITLKRTFNGLHEIYWKAILAVFTKC